MYCGQQISKDAIWVNFPFKLAAADSKRFVYWLQLLILNAMAY